MLASGIGYGPAQQYSAVPPVHVLTQRWPCRTVPDETTNPALGRHQGSGWGGVHSKRLYRASTPPSRADEVLVVGCARRNERNDCSILMLLSPPVRKTSKNYKESARRAPNPRRNAFAGDNLEALRKFPSLDTARCRRASLTRSSSRRCGGYVRAILLHL